MEPSEGSSRRNRIGGIKKDQMAGLYDLEETIGEGHYAVVKLAKHVFTGEKVAVKVIDKMKLDAATRMQMLQEVRLMKLVQHPYVVRLYEVIDTATKLYLVLEFADGGDMYDYIMKHEGGLEESTAKKYFRQIVTAIQYCHKLHVVHRDLKPENVVFFEKLGMVKLTDFGFSNKFNPGQRLQTSCGSLAYSAPEILLGDAYDAPAVDIWSLGVILYMLVCGTAPFQEANDSETLTMIMDCKYSFPSHISKNCRSLISRMLQRQPEVRASLEDIVQDPWLTEEDEADLAEAPGTAGHHRGLSEEEMIPLVTREHLTDEEHSSVLQRMVNGSIAHREDIILALDRNEYNHITATYFLLAERKLRMQQSQKANRNQQQQLQLQQEQKVEDGGRQLPQLRVAAKEAATAAASSPSSSSAPTSATSKKSDDSGSDAFSPGPLTLSTISMSTSLPGPQKPLVPSKRMALPSLTAPASASGGQSDLVEALFSPTKISSALRRKCTIVEEDEEEEEVVLETEVVTKDDCDVLQRGISRHSSTSSLADKAASSIPIPINPVGGYEDTQPALNLDLGFVPGTTPNSKPLVPPASSTSADGVSTKPEEAATPAPFPVASQIGTGVSLSRQSSLRRSGGETSCSSPASDRKSIPGSPTTPPGSNTPSSQGSPARHKLIMQPSSARKLAATRSSPQLVLKQIHEEVEEGGDPLENFPSSAAGAAVLRRLEQRRRLRLHKARTTSCSSSDASDDEESRKKHEKTPTPPPLGREPHDDSSDSNQDPGGLGGVSGSSASVLATKSVAKTTSATASKNQGSGDGANKSEEKTHVGRRNRHLHHNSSTSGTTGGGSGAGSSRVRLSRSLNRISELHVADFSKERSGDSSPGGEQQQQQPPFTSNCDNNMLCRYLESVRPQARSREDSLTSSDGEFEAGQQQSQRTRHKVNLRLLEQRLNKIQEECNNKSADEDGEEEDEAADGDVSDNVSTVAPDEDTTTKTKIIEIKSLLMEDNVGSNLNDETTSVKSCYEPIHYNTTCYHGNNNNMKQKPLLHRAHSCGSLFSLKERALLRRRLGSHLTSAVGAAFWDIINNANVEDKTGVSRRAAESGLTLTLTTASPNPLAVLQLQNTSRCCSLC